MSYSEKLTFPLTVRNRLPGDKFQPLGQSRPLKLKGFLINKRIPAEERDTVPLILSENRIAWVGGISMSDAFRVRPQTRHFIQLSLKQGNQL